VITTNVFHRVFNIQHGNGSGTCFTVDLDGRQYLVTARHVVEGIRDGGNVGIFFQGRWVEFPVQVVGIGEQEIDVAVLSMPIQLSPQYRLEPSSKWLTIGQDVFFLGFPYGIRAEPESLNRGFPFPLVKKGVVSSFTAPGNVEGRFLLDGHNNPGFSGGPVVFERPGRVQAAKGEIIKYDYRIAGIVSAYRYQEEPVHHQGQPTPLTFRANTGIVICYNISLARTMMEANPIGFTLPPKTADEADEVEHANEPMPNGSPNISSPDASGT
jgi:hypothetical protein